MLGLNTILFPRVILIARLWEPWIITLNVTERPSNRSGAEQPEYHPTRIASIHIRSEKYPDQPESDPRPDPNIKNLKFLIKMHKN